MDERLLIRFLTNNYSPDDLREINGWIAEDKGHAEWLFEMERVWMLKDEWRFSDEEVINRSYDQFLSRKNICLTPRRGKRRNGFFRVWKYGAAAVVLLLLFFSIYGSRYGRDSSAVTVIETRKGERASVTLSDGTKVWLNADTKFSYASRFGRKMREVSIEGEGYFEVARDEQKPFVLNGKDFNVHVLGTQFNVHAYPGEEVNIALKEGKVSVGVKDFERSFELNPSDQLRVTANGQTILQKIDVVTINSWTRGEFIFVAQPLAVILRSLERSFNVSIILEDESLSSELFTCRAQAGTSLRNLLGLLRETRKIDHRLDNGTIIITKN